MRVGQFAARPDAVQLRPVLEAAFGDLGPDATLLDLGAGSGVGTRTLAACTRARIIAVEPSRTMRSVLLARIADDGALGEQVSVMAGAVPRALEELPGEVAGFVCAHMLGHLTAAQRTETFAVVRYVLEVFGRCADCADVLERRR
ncbi:hypothetical protein GCM10027059_44230 [Myceligenerans halotolerans]